ncbi:helix-turn-helix domain-containing protein [Syntrophothermus lipocalidus]|uniref:Transcriptional regulator, XRE family n=1 Tax=Syntrophothermus lipocalidus (strain DSM 12680 / TGB-C1) TaxID=643648 RepID=D7CQ13_SYNLT|nr:helix-turn-helix transcriptional regulator [Syntrophothermus lipocalidus]ADI02791.1 transcriptional regulator, XRE family [Syntrophothermus lipocalidus DSM 12680]
MNTDNIGALVRKRRREKNMSLRTLAALMGVDPTHLSRIERGLTVPSEHLGSRLKAFVFGQPEHKTDAERIWYESSDLLGEARSYRLLLREAQSISDFCKGVDGILRELRSKSGSDIFTNSVVRHLAWYRVGIQDCLDVLAKTRLDELIPMLIPENSYELLQIHTELTEHEYDPELLRALHALIKGWSRRPATEDPADIKEIEDDDDFPI